MNNHSILYYAAEGTASEFEFQVKQIEKRDPHKHKAEKFNEVWEIRDKKGRNVLFHAAITDNLKNFLYIMKKRPVRREDFMNITDVNGANVLHWATQYNCIKIVKEILFLFEKDERQVIHELITSKDSESVTPLHIAATKHDVKILKMFIDCLKDSQSLRDLWQTVHDKRGRSPLHYAACKVNLEAIRTLVDPNGPNFPVDQRDKCGVIPLMCAVGVNLPQALPVIKLLDKKKPISKTRQNLDGMTALHIAVAARNLPAVECLIELGSSTDLMDQEHRTPLHYAAEHGYPEIVRFLLEKEARNTTRDQIGATPAHYAAQFSVECLKIIFEKSKIKEVKDNEKRSCFMWAVCAGNVDAINYLIQQDTDGQIRRDFDKHGYSALHLAAMVGNENVCRILMNQGWPTSERDNHGNTALHLASGRGHTDVVRLLVSKGTALNDTDEVGRTPIFWACMGGQSHTLHCMIKELGFEWRTAGTNGIRPITDNFGRTALHAAANAGFSGCINVLLNVEQEDNFLPPPGLFGFRDKNGETALHEACLAGKLDCVLALLKGGSDINAVGRLKRTPLDCARTSNEDPTALNKLMLEHLKSLGAKTYAELDRAAVVVQRWWRGRRRRGIHS